MFYRAFVIIGILFFVSLPAFATQKEEIDTANKVFGLKIWNDDSLWDDPAAEVARRLHWPQESETSIESSFRLYPSPQQRVLEAQPFSLALMVSPVSLQVFQWSLQTKET
jgi:hypothetical protein